MASSIPEMRQGCVAGFVKGGKSNRDHSVTFWVAKQRFVINEGSSFVRTLHLAKRALVCFETGASKNPKITLVLAEPSVRLIREYMEA